MTLSTRIAAASRPVRVDAIWIFLAIVLSHWAEHTVQAMQIYVLGWPPREALGLLGPVAPDLVRSEWLHWSYNLAVLVGLWLLLPAFSDRARTWWTAALVVQAWHFFEHLLLLVQAQTGAHLLDRELPTSVVQLVVPRVELHLFYNGIVTSLLLVGVAVRKRGASLPLPSRPLGPSHRGRVTELRPRSVRRAQARAGEVEIGQLPERTSA